MKRLHRFLWFIMKWALAITVTIALFYHGAWNAKYILIWDNRIAEVEREREKLVIATQLIRSQKSWERQAETMRSELVETHGRLIIAERELKQSQYEFYHFLRTLQNLHPDVYKEVTEDIRKPKKPFFFFPQKGQPSCEENFCN